MKKPNWDGGAGKALGASHLADAAVLNGAPSPIDAQADEQEILLEAGAELAAAAAEATSASPNEANLRHHLENALKAACDRVDIAWSAFTLDLTLREGTEKIRFADAIHGTLVIEYEPPRVFGSGSARAKVRHAQGQAEEYIRILAADQGRELGDYQACIWDGESIGYGSHDGKKWEWQPVRPFDSAEGAILLRRMAEAKPPLVAPLLLTTATGPDSAIGRRLLPAMFTAIRTAEAGPTTKTKLLYTEWLRFFGQAVGIQTEKLQRLMRRQEIHHGAAYSTDVKAYLYVLHTYIGIIAKLVAALSLPQASTDLSDSRRPVRDRLKDLEGGQVFYDAGIVNMLSGDFFSWYADDAGFSAFEAPLNDLLAVLGELDYDSSKKSPSSTRDLFKGIYQDFVPRELRHALGEVYTPDWLAAHALDRMGWRPENDLLDPNGGSGTFVLEALRRRLQQATAETSAEALLSGLYAIDLNPLAVLCAKASIVVTLASRIDPVRPIRLPIFLGDAIDMPVPVGDKLYVHTLMTEQGDKQFTLPVKLVENEAFHQIIDAMRVAISADGTPQQVYAAGLSQSPGLDLDAEETNALRLTVETLVDLHRRKWDGIWCPILADRFAAAAIRPVSHIGGNPPWVKWSHLPPAYATHIQPHCRQLNVFSSASYVGGIEADISTVITFSVIRRLLADGGTLGFYITGTVFTNPSSEGFRRFAVNSEAGPIQCEVIAVEDFEAVRPFSGVSNHPALLIVKRARSRRRYAPYRLWRLPPGLRPADIGDADAFRSSAKCIELLAAEVPGTDGGPWMKGTISDHRKWALILDGNQPPPLEARKGVTTDLNGLFFLQVVNRDARGFARVRNNPDLGRKSIAERTALIEDEHLFPLLRGRGVSQFRVAVDEQHAILVPQRGMHGDPDLPATATRTHRFLALFKGALEQRSSYKRFQRGKPFWSVWSTGSYTFSPYKVVWQEMGGGRFAAAYTTPTVRFGMPAKPVVPDHKVYFVPVSNLQQAQFLTAILNAPSVAEAVDSFSAALSQGTNAINFLRIPPFDRRNADHLALAKLAGAITKANGRSTPAERRLLDEIALRVITTPRTEQVLKSVRPRHIPELAGLSAFWSRLAAISLWVKAITKEKLNLPAPPERLSGRLERIRSRPAIGNRRRCP